MAKDQAADDRPGQESITLLSKARDECFDRVCDLDLPLETRNEFSKRHKQLGEIIEKLSAKRFHEASAEFKNQKELQDQNKKLSEHVKDLDGMGKNIDNAQKFFNVFDQVIQVGLTLVTLV